MQKGIQLYHALNDYSTLLENLPFGCLFKIYVRSTFNFSTRNNFISKVCFFWSCPIFKKHFPILINQEDYPLSFGVSSFSKLIAHEHINTLKIPVIQLISI